MSKDMIQLVNVVKKFDENTAVNDISVNVKQGEFLTLLGPSGCGKTTTLRMIAGFEKPTSGQILLDGDHVENKEPFERNVNTVFQNYALFPHMNIFDNIAFGMKMKKISKEIIREKVLDMLKLVQLEGYENRTPDQLSGGQKQRIAIARALINNPKVLLLDEPLGALDLKLRKQMQVELKHLQRKLGITFIYVTHDQEEALTMSDRIAVMNKGKIEQIGTADEIYEKPITKFVADFIGETNLFEGQISKNESNNKVLISEDNEFPMNFDSLTINEEIAYAIRPERIKISNEKVEGCIALEAILKERRYVGSIVKTVMTLKNGREIIINEPAGQVFNFENDKNTAYITWKLEDGVVMNQ